MEFDRAARDGDISVRGYGYTSGKYEALDMYYWHASRLDALDILNPAGSKGRTQEKDKPFRDLLVNRQGVTNTWPRAGLLFRCCNRFRLLVNRYGIVNP